MQKTKKSPAPAGTSRWIVEQARKLKARKYAFDATVQALNEYLKTHTGSTDDAFVRTYVEVAYGRKPSRK